LKTLASYSEPELLHAIASGDKDAFAVIYQQHFAAAYHFAKRFVTDTQTAEDITTEAFVKLWERFSQFSSLSGIKSFLFTSIKNACINHARSAKRTTKRESEFTYLLNGHDEPQENITGEVYQHIYNEIEKLPSQEKRVFKMAYLEGLSNEAIAQELGINNQSVRNHKTRALKTLRNTLSEKDLYALFMLLIGIHKIS
jgi:RNA polymerase sigma-70 factor (family 1)